MTTVTDFTARLFQGDDEIDLSGIPYCIADGFIPPSVSLVPLIATGTSANVISGGSKRGIRAVDRSLFLPIKVEGSSDKEVRIRAGVLANFLQRGTEQNPVIFELRTSSDIEFLPSWGQDGSAFRFEIIHASVPTISQPEYMQNGNRGFVVFVDTDLLIKPYATGLQQQLALAAGGIIENTIGTVDGSSRGTTIPQATTNKIPNPIFGNATPLLGWVSFGAIITTVNTNKQFVLFQFNSAKLTGAPGVFSRLLRNIDVGNTNTHFLTAYAKRQDGAEVTVADVSLFYGSKLTTGYISEGDGWYRLTASVTGVAANTLTGVFIENGHTIYLDGVQIEEQEFATPLCHGDLLGCSWSGTDHDSTSTRLRGEFDAPVIRDVAEGYIRVVWRAGNDSTELILVGSTREFFEGTNFRLQYRMTQTDWSFRDGTTSIDTPISTFVVNQVVILHCVWGPAGLAIYLDGILRDSSATYTPTASEALTIGSSIGHANHPNGTFLDFTVGDREITIAEVTNDHTNVVKAVEDGVRLMPIPYFWTKDGDGILDTGDTSTTDNWGIIGGIAGSAEADTVYQVDPTTFVAVSGWLTKTTLDYGDFLRPTSPIWFHDKVGTADANANGGFAETLALSSTNPDDTTDSTIVNPDLLTGTIQYFFRARNLGGGGDVTYEVTPIISNGGALIRGRTVNIDVRTVFDVYFQSSVLVSEFSNIINQDQKFAFVQLEFNDPNTGSETDVLVDYEMTVNGPFLRVDLDLQLLVDILVRGTDSFNVSPTTASSGRFNTDGQPVEPTPDKWNIIWFFIGETSVITETFEFDFIKITPRWYLL